MQFVIHTSDVGRFALYAGAIALLLVCLLVIQVSIIRLQLMVVQKRRIRLQNIWRKIISKILIGEEPEFPVIKKKDVFYILEEFDYFFGVIRGSESDALRKCFRELELPIPLDKLLNSHDIKKKLFALITLGNIREKSAWDMIIKYLPVTQPVISLSAARALVLIEPQRALDEIVPLIFKRKDWPWANVAHILKLAGPKLVCGKLSPLVIDAEVNKQASLLRLYDVLRCEEELPVTCKVLVSANEDKVISVCLKVSQDPNIIDMARKYARHDRWHVRMNAAVALGRFGQEEDVPLLVELVKDKEWWVRYRAAQALYAMPFVDQLHIMQIRTRLSDRYGDDIFVQAISEAKYD